MPTCWIALTSWEFLGEVSSKSELCGHRKGNGSVGYRGSKHLDMGCAGIREGPIPAPSSREALSVSESCQQPLQDPDPEHLPFFNTTHQAT